MKDWRIQRPAIMWVETTVQAETLEQALELADERINEGDFIEITEDLDINFDKYWAEDEEGITYD